jgi:drug/metabolite transporter (DMT)-like permease
LKKLSAIAFVALGIIWGSNFIYMKMASQYVTPLQVVFLRVLFGFIPVALYSAYSKSLKLSHVKYIFHFFVMSVLATVLYYFSFVKGSSLLPSGIAGALSGAIPIFAFLLAILFLHEEKASKTKIAGIIIGFIGVIIIAKPSDSKLFEANFEGIIYMVLGSLSVGASFIYAKKYILPLGIKASALTTYQLGLGLIVLSFITNMSNINNIYQNLHVALGMVVGLGLLGTGLAYIIYYYIIEKLGAVVASSVTYIPPIVALFIGAFIVNEKIELSDYAATLMIFAGVYLINNKHVSKIKVK